jgi:hypothetical protein
MSKFGLELIASLKQAAEHARGGKVPGMRWLVQPREGMASRVARTKPRAAPRWHGLIALLRSG